MTVELNKKYYYANHFIIVKKDGVLYRWLVLNERNEIVKKSEKSLETPENAYLYARSFFTKETG